MYVQSIALYALSAVLARVMAPLHGRANPEQVLPQPMGTSRGHAAFDTAGPLPRHSWIDTQAV